MYKCIFIILLVIIVSAGYFIIYGRSSLPAQVLQLTNTKEKIRHPDLTNLYGNVELTVRLAVTNELVLRFLCSLLRSAVVFWNPSYGDVLLILDEEDRPKQQIQNQLSQLELPFQFRQVYEDRPIKEGSFGRLAREHERPYGYIRQLYSSFLMDLYTRTTVIAWIDTDAVFTMPVTNDSIARNGRLVVKGVNSFDRRYVEDWDHSTRLAIGQPMVADFMSYFPIYIYPSTIRICREFIIKRFSVPTFEHAFFRFAQKAVSSVNIIMSYAYYFERDRYEWHIDTGKLNLNEYNSKRLPKRAPLLQRDILPETHITIHSRYYNYLAKYDPLEQAICYAQINVGMNNSQHCNVFRRDPNLMLFEFQREPSIGHLDTWCFGERRKECVRLISDRYRNSVSFLRRESWF